MEIKEKDMYKKEVLVWSGEGYEFVWMVEVCHKTSTVQGTGWGKATDYYTKGTPAKIFAWIDELGMLDVVDLDVNRLRYEVEEYPDYGPTEEDYIKITFKGTE